MMTIKEIANLSGVSKSTVSRVLNNNGYVNQETREKVEKVIMEQDYTPSAAARSLSKQETNTIGVIIPEIDNSFFGEVIKGITEIADDRNFSIICCDTQNSGEKEFRALRMLEHQRVRGIIMTPAMGYSDIVSVKKLKSILSKLNVPVVIVDRDFEHSSWDTVSYENYQSGYIATKSLIEAGNTEIGFIQGDMALKIAKDRFEGYLDAMEEFGYEVKEEYVLPGDFTVETAFILTKKAIEEGNLPKAIVTANNRTTLGFMKALRGKNLTIGKHIAVIGIDHEPLIDIFCDNFSCVSRDTEEMGRVSMRLLLKRMKDTNKGRNIVMIPCQLELKGSEKVPN
ncbi:MAG: LacI family transcriptional regulator [Vallitaleaceae bacterium]|nr:LacI family transcriptional regulator [Vallitaleaceae bacterium]